MSDGRESGWSNVFRGFIGVLALTSSVAALAGLYFIIVPTGNKEPLLLAIGIIMGWGSSIVNSEYGATSTGRKVVDSAVRNIERQNVAAADALVAATPSPDPVPADAVEAAQDTADAAQTKADKIKGAAK